MPSERSIASEITGLNAARQNARSISLQTWFNPFWMTASVTGSRCTDAPCVLPPLPTCGERVGVRGCQLSQYMLCGRVGICQHLIVPNPHDTKPCRLEFRVSCAIVLLLVRVLASIQFDDQFFLETDKIRNVSPYGM